MEGKGGKGKGKGKGERERAGNPQNLYAAYAHEFYFTQSFLKIIMQLRLHP
jgi:hypothetical protein